MIKVNALGDACPIPVVKTKKAIKEMNGAGAVEVSVDNEIAVQNLTKMAKQKGYEARSEKVNENEYRVVITVREEMGTAAQAPFQEKKDLEESKEAGKEACTSCISDVRKKNMVVAVSSAQMGTGDDKLGSVLIKGFIYALTQQDELPQTILFYNGGARLTCEDAPTLEDLKSLEAQGVEILTCGTCLNHYGLADKLQVGGVTNMYDIVEKMTQASLLVKP